jgi:hypothetical protein
MPCDSKDIPEDVRQRFMHFAGLKDKTSLYAYLHVSCTSDRVWKQIEIIWEKYKNYELLGMTRPPAKKPKTGKISTETILEPPKAPLPLKVLTLLDA